MAIFTGAFSVLCFALFAAGLTNFLSRGERVAGCGVAGCHSLLVGIVLCGLMGIVTAAATVAALSSARKSG